MRGGDSLKSAIATKRGPRGELASRSSRSLVRLERDTEMGSSDALAAAFLRRRHMMMPMPHAAPPKTTSTTIKMMSRDDVFAGAAT